MRRPMDKTCRTLAFLTILVGTAFGQEGQLVLDQTGYWRYHLTCRPVRVCPGPIKAGAEKLLSKPMLLRLQQAAAKLGSGPGWMDSVTFTSSTGDGRTGAYYALLGRLSTTPPPGGWMRPGFDDTDWARHREPYLLGREVP